MRPGPSGFDRLRSERLQQSVTTYIQVNSWARFC